MFESMSLSKPPETGASSANLCSLADLHVGDRARIVRVGHTGQGADIANEALELRLLEMGFEEGSEVELAHIGSIGRDPLAFKVHGTLIALRRREASTVAVELLDD